MKIKKPERTLPLNIQILNNLRENIEEGRLKKLPPERELAELYRVSRITIRLALSKLQDEGLLSRIRKRGTYIGKIGIKLKNPLLKNILFLVDNDFYRVTRHFYSLVLKGAESEARRKREINFIFRTLDGKNPEKSIKRIVDKERIDGILIISLIDARSLEIDKKLPMVFIDPAVIYKGYDTIGFDNIDGASQAVKYLYRLGHRNIVHITGPKNLKGLRERCKGYKNTLKALGLDSKKNLIVTAKGVEPKDGYRAAIDLIESSIYPTAIFAGNDMLAIGIMDGIKRKGLKIPEDISIVGFDDIELASQTVPPLTTVRVPKEKLGILGIRKLIARLADKKTKPENITLPVKLIIRESVKCI